MKITNSRERAAVCWQDKGYQDFLAQSERRPLIKRFPQFCDLVDRNKDLIIGKSMKTEVSRKILDRLLDPENRMYINPVSDMLVSLYNGHQGPSEITALRGNIWYLRKKLIQLSIDPNCIFTTRYGYGIGIESVDLYGSEIDCLYQYYKIWQQDQQRGASDLVDRQGLTDGELAYRLFGLRNEYNTSRVRGTLCHLNIKLDGFPFKIEKLGRYRLLAPVN